MLSHRIRPVSEILAPHVEHQPMQTVFDKSLVNCETSGHAQPFLRANDGGKL
jgi:hypothetical protein